VARRPSAGGQAARDAFVASIDEDFVPLVLALDRAIMAAGPELDCRISYQLLMYAQGGDYRHWICAIDARRTAVRVRFLRGDRFTDPGRVLRAGTSTLRTLDYGSSRQFDAELVMDFVRQALSVYASDRTGGHES
jgi:hypothetical protein